MCVDTTKEQVRKNIRIHLIKRCLKDVSMGLKLVSLLLLDRHDDITKDILELDPWGGRWTVVARHALMHDNYDVCLVASLNPRGLMSPPADLVKQ